MARVRKPLSERDKLYRIWQHMHNRCYKPEAYGYKHYGGRGITVCERWKSFANFYADMSPRPAGLTMDRIDGDKGYYPENVRWATYGQQIRNRRMTRFITMNGETMCLKDWTRRLGLRYNTIQDRVKKGWLPEIALTTPISPDNAQFRLANRALVTGGVIRHSTYFAKACSVPKPSEKP